MQRKEQGRKEEEIQHKAKERLDRDELGRNEEEAWQRFCDGAIFETLRLCREKIDLFALNVEGIISEAMLRGL